MKYNWGHTWQTQIRMIGYLYVTDEQNGTFTVEISEKGTWNVIVVPSPDAIELTSTCLPEENRWWIQFMHENAFWLISVLIISSEGQTFLLMLILLRGFNSVAWGASFFCRICCVSEVMRKFWFWSATVSYRIIIPVFQGYLASLLSGSTLLPLALVFILSPVFSYWCLLR